MYFGSWSAVLEPCLFAMCYNSWSHSDSLENEIFLAWTDWQVADQSGISVSLKLQFKVQENLHGHLFSSLCPNLPSFLPFHLLARRLWLWGKKDASSLSNVIPGLVFFPLFQIHYHSLPYLKTKGSKILTKDKVKPQHIILYACVCCSSTLSLVQILFSFV